MPLHLEPLDVSADLEDARSVLVVPCPICPPISLAIRKESPLIELLKGGLKTGAFEDYIDELREPLERQGVRTGTFSTYMPCPTMCLWTKGQRSRLKKRAAGHDIVLVLGCDSAVRTAQQAVEGTRCRVVQGMETTGLTNARLRVRFPVTVALEDAVRVSASEGIARSGRSPSAPSSTPSSRRELPT